MKVHNDVIQILGAHDNAARLLLDLSAAFDTVDHEILIDRLRVSFGITGKTLKWIREYLTNRTQRVLIQGTPSSPAIIKYGVPQGSVLGPFLFTLYTAPLCQIITDSGLWYHLYADDTQIYTPVSSKTSFDAVERIEQCTAAIKTWMTGNMLKLNDDKTELIIFRKKSTSKFLDTISVNGCTIKCTTSVRNLEHLSMTCHITKLCQTLYWQVCNIGRVRGLLDEDTTKLLVHTLITSRLDYCNSLYFNLPKSSLRRLKRVQNTAVRNTTRTKARDRITPVMKSLHWLPVDARIDYKLGCITYKSLNGLDPPI